MKKYLGFLFIISLLFLSTSCDIDNPEFRRVEDVQIREINKDKVSLDVDITSYNPNKHKVKIRKSKMKLYVNGAYLGDAYLLKKYIMTKKDTVTQSVPVEIQLEKGILFSLIGLASKREVEIRLEGKLNVSYAGIPASKKVDQTRKVSLNDLNLNLGDLLKGIGF